MSLASSPRPTMRGQFIDADVDLAGLGAALWRKRGQIIRPTLAVALLAVAAVMLITPKYQSESRVLVVGRDNVFLRPDADKDIVDRGVVDPEAVTSQVQLVLSRDLASQVIAELKLNEKPEFDPALSGVSLIKSLLGFVGIVRNPLSMTPEERVLEAYYDRLSAYAVEKSRVIVIDFLSENPELAARVANAVADGYIKLQQEAKQEQARTAGAWLAGQIEQMRKRVAEAEAKVEAFRAKSNLLVGPNNTTLSTQQLGDLNAQLAAARTQKVDAETRAKLIRGMLKSGEPIESFDILNSELIRRLSEQRVTLRAQLAEQSSSLLDGHPRIKELRAQIADLDQQIRKEAETMARSLENDAKLADARVAAQLATFDQLKSQAASSNEDDVQLRALERDAKSQRDLLESYMAKYREASAHDTIASAPADARVISRATVSNLPAYPKKLPTVLIASLATLVLCSGIVITRELLAAPVIGATGASRHGDGKVDSEPVGDAERERPPRTKNPLTARLRAAVQASPPPVGVPVGAIEEFARNLHQVGASGEQMALFGATSDLGTGRIAVRFARALARDARVVLVGLDAGDAAIEEISGDPSAPGLAELANGGASFGEVITRDRASGLNLIAAGRARMGRSALLGAAGMARNFAALAHAYPHVVINAGALIGRTFDGDNLPGNVERDLRTLARLAPHAILVADTLTGAATTKARGQLADAGFDNVTIVIAGGAGHGDNVAAA
jgi:tyrosine-protein kinase Etk/Wzc